MNEELVSIVIPLYNAEKYLNECLDSVLAQTHKNIEIILVNDGSSDSSEAICNKYMSENKGKICYIKKENEGLSSARHVGINAVSGEFFCTIDSDDMLDKEYIALLLDSVIKNDADIALCSRIAFDEYSKKEMPIPGNLVQVKKIDQEVLESEYWKMALAYQMSDSWNKMYRTDFVKQSGIFHELDRKYNGTDLLFNHLLLLHMPTISTVHRSLYKYRIVKGSIVHRKDKNLQGGFEKITLRLLEECTKLNYNEKIKKQVLLTYYGMMKYATTDIVEYYHGRQRNKKLKDCVLEHRKFIESIGTDIDSQYFSDVESKALRVFFKLLRHRNYRGILVYYKVRSLTQLFC